MVAKKAESSTEASKTPLDAERRVASGSNKMAEGPLVAGTETQDPQNQRHARNIRNIDESARRLQEEKQRREDEIKNSELGVKLSEIRSNRAELIGYEEKSTQSLYQMISKIVGFVRSSRTKEGRRLFSLMCSHLGINPRDNSDIAKNEYLPHFRVLFQTDSKDKLTAQMYKWAMATRALIDEGVDEPEVVEYIDNFTYKNKTKLAALIAIDSNNHRTNRGNQSSREDQLYKLLRKTEDFQIATIEVEETPPTAEKLCLVLGEVEKGGKIVLRKFYEGDDLPNLLVKFLPKKEKKSVIEKVVEAVGDDEE